MSHQPAVDHNTPSRPGRSFRRRLGLLLCLAAPLPVAALSPSDAAPPSAPDTVCPARAAGPDDSAAPRRWLLEADVESILRGETPPALRRQVALGRAGEPTLWSAWHRERGSALTGLRGLTHDATTLELFDLEIEEKHLARLVSATSGLWSRIDSLMVSGSRIVTTSRDHDIGKEGVGGSLLLVGVELPRLLWIGPDISTGVPPADPDVVATRIRPEVEEAFNRTSALPGSLTLECVKAGNITLFGLRVDGEIEFAHVEADSIAAVGRMRVQGGVSLRHVTASTIDLGSIELPSPVRLSAVHTATLDLYGTTFGSSFAAEELTLGELFRASKATFGGPVTLRRSRIGIDFRDQPERGLTSSLTFEEPFVMRGSRLDDSLVLEDVQLPAGLVLDESEIAGDVVLSGIALGSDSTPVDCRDQWRLSFRNARLAQGLRLAVDLNASLDLRAAEVGSLDLELLPPAAGRSLGCLWLNGLESREESWKGLEALECDRFMVSEETVAGLRQRFAASWGEKAAKRWAKRIRRCKRR